MRFKRPLLLLATLIIFLSAFAGYAYCETSIMIKLNGRPTNIDMFDTGNGVPMVSVRQMLEALGMIASWDENARAVNGTDADREITIGAGSKYAYVNSKQVEMDAPADIINDRMVVPLRFFAENVGLDMVWDEEARTIYISTKEDPSKDVEKVAAGIHRSAWKTTAELAAVKPDYKYAIYESRTLAVKHPEIYLKADALFDRILCTYPSMMDYFLERSQNFYEQEKKYKEISFSRGRMFRWADFNIGTYHQISHKSIYGSEAFFPFLDIRLHFMGTALKATDWRATPLSMAEFLYFKYKDEARRPYILVQPDGKAYVSVDGRSRTTGTLIDYTGREIKELKDRPMLIFNEDYVWYPLMGRDDTGNDTELLKLVKKHADGLYNAPALDADEAYIVNLLRKNTGIMGRRDYLWALTFAGRIHCDLWSSYPEIWRELYPQDALNEGLKRNDGPVVFTARNSYIARLSNHLNPAAAKFAAIARNMGDELGKIADATVSKYLDYVATSSEPRFSYLSLWSSLEQYYQNMDDNFLSKAGICLTSASNTAAIFDLAEINGLENYIVGVSYKYQKGGHAYNPLFYKGESGIVENISWRKGINGINVGEDGKVLKYVITKNGWIVMGEYEVYKAPVIRTSLAVKVAGEGGAVVACGSATGDASYCRI